MKIIGLLPPVRHADVGLPESKPRERPVRQIGPRSEIRQVNRVCDRCSVVPHVAAEAPATGESHHAGAEVPCESRPVGVDGSEVRKAKGFWEAVARILK